MKAWFQQFLQILTLPASKSGYFGAGDIRRIW